MFILQAPPSLGKKLMLGTGFSGCWATETLLLLSKEV